MEKKLHSADAAFGIAIAFLLGVLAASLRWNIYLALTGGLTGGISTLAATKKWRSWPALIIFAGGVLFGVVYYHVYLDRQVAKNTIPLGKKIHFSAVISDEPSPSQKFDILTVDVQAPYSGSVRILAPPESDFKYGFLLQIDGAVNAPDVEGELPVVFSPKLKLLAEHRGFWLRETLINLKLAILAKFNALLPKDEAALLGGIVFGSKVSFGADLKNAMSLSGTTHLVAISGYNITIIIVAASQVFGRIFSKRKTFYLTIIFIVLFILMAGFQASAIRAAIMGFLALLAGESGRLYDIRNSVAFTAVFMVLFDPTILVHDAGFQLSFLSLLGIVYLGPPVKKLFHYKDGGLLDWKENGVTTFAAQLGVIPVLVGTFGQFSATAILANICILSTVPLTMLLGFVLAALGFVSFYAASFTAQIVGFVLWYQLSMIRLFAKLAVPLPLAFNSPFSIAAYYVALIVLAHHYAAQKTSTAT